LRTTLLHNDDSKLSHLHRLSNNRCSKTCGDIVEIKTNYVKALTKVFIKPPLMWMLWRRFYKKSSLFISRLLQFFNDPSLKSCDFNFNFIFTFEVDYYGLLNVCVHFLVTYAVCHKLRRHFLHSVMTSKVCRKLRRHLAFSFCSLLGLDN